MESKETYFDFSDLMKMRIKETISELWIIKIKLEDTFFGFLVFMKRKLKWIFFRVFIFIKRRNKENIFLIIGIMKRRLKEIVFFFKFQIINQN